MTVEVTVDLANRRRDLILSELAAAMLDVPTRDAVNAAALVETTDARRRVQAAVGPDQRLSGVLARWRDGKRREVLAKTRAKGGTRINPYYREALSDTNPTALVGVRGPAHYIEHRRRGGYEIRPARKATLSADLSLLDLFTTGPGADTTVNDVIGQNLRRPALKLGPDRYRARTRGGAIISPLAPITAAFEASAGTVHDAARATLEQSMSRAAQDLGRSTRAAGRSGRRLARQVR